MTKNDHCPKKVFFVKTVKAGAPRSGARTPPTFLLRIFFFRTTRFF